MSKRYDMNKKYKNYLKKFNKILYIEDGSVDIDSLKDWAEAQGIQIVVYRQGANKPELLKLKKDWWR